MAPAEWPLRLIPTARPPWWKAALVSLVAIAVSIVLRVLLVGTPSGLGLSSTHFPALILVTLYAGGRWGIGALIVLVLIGYSRPNISAASPEVVSIMFAVSGALTVLVSSALRATLVRLRQEHEERGRVEAQLERRSERLAVAQEAAGVGIWDWDLVSGTAYWSPTFFRNVGLDENLKAPSGDALLEACHPDDRERMREVLRAAGRTGEKWEMEYRVVHPDGEVRWILARGEGKVDAEGRPTRFLGVNIDITSQRLAEEQLRESEARFRALADSAPVLMWVTGRDGQREFVNKAYIAFMEADASYEAALALDWRTRLHPEDAARVVADEHAYDEALRTGAGPVVVEARFRRGDGEWRWMRAISQPRIDSTGAVTGFIGIAIDISNSKQAEADLKRINELLEERISEALGERDAAQAALARVQRLEALGQLTGGVAHDFNNLLTVVIGALDMIARHPDDAPRRERMVEAALSAAHRGERLTQQLLAFARRQPLKTERLEIDGLLRENAPLLGRAVGEAVDFSIAPGAPGLFARIDPVQLEAALMNLAVNARDAVATGGAVRIETRPCELVHGQVEEAEAGHYICLAVHDTGVGMDADVLARVFEPFFTTKPVGKGTGLGLSQVYGFARQSGGGASVESEPGKGCTIRLYLPIDEAPAALAETAAPAVADEAPSALDVLLVEDDDAVAELVSEMLQDLGHRVRHAPDAHAALKVIATDAAIGLLLTDIVMPGGKNGVELAREAIAQRPDLPVILSSGYSGDTLGPAEEAPWPLLRKPYTRDGLKSLIQQVTSEPAI
ncbi:MAG TPA: PAS domain-containing protein [Phenylobacterium sp.]|nr:PAS domain-containing protein [Phenylobacterium sp.]